MNQNANSTNTSKNAKGLAKDGAKHFIKQRPSLDILSHETTEAKYDKLESIARKIKFTELRKLFLEMYTKYFDELSNFALSSAVDTALKLLEMKICRTIARAEKKDYLLDERTLIHSYIVQLHSHLSERLEWVRQNIENGHAAKIEKADVCYWFADFEFRPYDVIRSGISCEGD